MAHRNVIVIEGGGAKGPYGSGVLEQLEDRVGRRIGEFIDLVVGTSVGAVLGSLICTGKISARDLACIVLNELPTIFKKRGWFFPIPKYSHDNYVDCYMKYIGPDVFMKDLMVKLMCTTVDRCEPKVHYLKSWESKDGELLVTEAVVRSFSAPYFFGATIDPADQKVWMDGGMSYNNLPLIQAYIEILRQGWLNDGGTVHILGIGMGRPNNSVTFKRASKRGILKQTIDQIRKYMDISDGGLAREMATLEQVRSLEAICHCTPNLTFQWVDHVLPKSLDKMDNVKARHVYYRMGLNSGQDIDVSKFRTEG